MDRIYLLSMEELSEKLLEEAFEKIDKERRQKLERITHKKKRLEGLGAGLLLQLAVQEALAEEETAGKVAEGAIKRLCPEGTETDADRVEQLTISQLLSRVQAPLPLAYTYGEAGKPYLKNYPFYFSLSHSGSYVLCVLSRREVGADIQLQLPETNERLMQRFFTEEESFFCQQCASAEEKEDCFYRLWSCKEAYGKLTGKGLTGALPVNMSFILQNSPMGEGQSEVPFVIKEYPAPEHYRIAVCKWKE